MGNDGECATQRKKTFNIEYLSSLFFLRRGNIQEEFINCLVFRVSLYILRQQVFKFLKSGFEKLIKDSSDNSKSIKQAIKNKVRITDPSGDSLEYASLRIDRINALDVQQFVADWRTFAICYTGRFVTSKYRPTQIKLEDFHRQTDPTVLLEILKNCSLFSDDMYLAAYALIGNRNQFYGHPSVLLIDSETLKRLDDDTETLVDLISA